MISLTLKRGFVLIGCFLPVVLGIKAIINGEIRVYFNSTDSLPHTVYIGLKSEPLVFARGHYVAFIHPRYPNHLLIKQIKGVPGEGVNVQDGQLRIGEETFPLLNQTKDGTPLHPLKTPMIPHDCVFVAGTNPRSFDSRYEEFGLIHPSQIKGRVWPLF